MQNALDSIVKSHLKSETLLFGSELQNDSEEQFISSLNKCFEEKGVLKELQIFLRERLVSILKGSAPLLVTSSQGEISEYALSLFTDFLASHKLLFTFSVLSSEIEDKYIIKDDYGKLPREESELLLEKIGFRAEKASEIIEYYLSEENCSLLEGIFKDSLDPEVSSRRSWSKRRSQISSEEEADYQNTFVSEASSNPSQRKSERSDKRLEESKGDAINRIRNEIETKLRNEMKDREKDIVKEFERKFETLRKGVEKEKESWLKDQRQRNSPKKPESPTNTDEEGNGLKTKEFEKNAGSPYSKQVERNYLLKEAHLRSQIERLMAENKQLKNQAINLKPMERYDSEPDFANPPSTKRKAQQISSAQRSYEDKIAMLQYKVECQSEEIESLKKIVQSSDKLKNREKGDLGASLLDNYDSDIDNFLLESKRRCGQIEMEKKTLESCLFELKGKTKNYPPSPVSLRSESPPFRQPPSLHEYDPFFPTAPRIPSDLLNFSPETSTGDRSSLAEPPYQFTMRGIRSKGVDKELKGRKNIIPEKIFRQIHPNKIKMTRRPKSSGQTHVSFDRIVNGKESNRPELISTLTQLILQRKEAPGYPDPSLENNSSSSSKTSKGESEPFPKPEAHKREEPIEEKANQSGALLFDKLVLPSRTKKEKKNLEKERQQPKASSNASKSEREEIQEREQFYPPTSDSLHSQRSKRSSEKIQPIQPEVNSDHSLKSQPLSQKKEESMISLDVIAAHKEEGDVEEPSSSSTSESQASLIIQGPKNVDANNVLESNDDDKEEEKLDFWDL